MAQIEPLPALHYDTSVVGALEDVVAPPYDVIDMAQRAELLARSQFNIVEIDLPKGDGDIYAEAAGVLDAWLTEGAMVRDPMPALWILEQAYVGPDGVARTRRGFFCRVRLEDYGAGRVRPHERTHPGPKEDRLRLTRATKTNISPIFSLYSDPEQLAWSALQPFTEKPVWGEVELDGVRNRLWRVHEEHAVKAVQSALADRELLIADGHHRYETMRTYAEEVGGEGAHNYILMCLVALEDPGLEIFPTHRLVRGLDEARRTKLRELVERDFTVQEVALEDLAPPAGRGPMTVGYIDSGHKRPLRLTLRDQAIADAALSGYSPAYRELDTGVLETLVLRGALGMSEEDIAEFNGMFYARDAREAIEMVGSGDYEAAFLMRPPPVRQVQEIAAAGENMPPKSTFFFPKLPTGLLLNPLV